MTANHDGPGTDRGSESESSPTASHCPVCQSATPARGAYLIARAMTVETSRLYAELVRTERPSQA